MSVLDFGSVSVTYQLSPTAIESNGRIKIISIFTTHHKQLHRQPVNVLITSNKQQWRDGCEAAGKAA